MKVGTMGTWAGTPMAVLVGLALTMAATWIDSAAAKATPACAVQWANVNGDAWTDVTDVQCLLLTAFWELLGESSEPPGCLAASVADADVNCDGAVNVSDIQASIHVVLIGEFAPIVDTDQDGCVDACSNAFGSLQVVVRATGGGFVEGASVSWGNVTMQTDETGRAALFGVSPGQGTIQVRHPNYAPAARLAEVTAGEAAKFEIVIVPTTALGA